MLSLNYTLMIPTYNRPNQLASLLTYLYKCKFKFQILVLDSSSCEVKLRNKEFIKKFDMEIKIIDFASTLPPFEKFWQGSLSVTTKYCSLCADDDLLFVDGILDIISFLDNNDDYCAAHGWYFFLTCTKERLDFLTPAYIGSSLSQADPLLRLRDIFNKYEAITYAVYRTSIFQTTFSKAQNFPNILAQELGTAAIAVASGKIARLSTIYYGRVYGEQIPVGSCHPFVFLSNSPQKLFESLNAIREQTVECLLSNNPNIYVKEELDNLIDLYMLTYISEYLTKNILTQAISNKLSSLSESESIHLLNNAIITTDNHYSALGKFLLTLQKIKFLELIRTTLFAKVNFKQLLYPKSSQFYGTSIANNFSRTYAIHQPVVDFIKSQNPLEYKEQLNQLVLTCNEYSLITPANIN